MAAVRTGFSRLAASCPELDCTSRLPVLKSSSLNVGPSSYSAAGAVRNVIFGRSGPSRFPYFSLCNDVHLGSTVEYRSCISVGCLHFRGLSTGAGSASGAGCPHHVLRVPSLGESITEGTVVEWRRGVGSVVDAEEVVCVLETDKVSVDIHSDIPGRIVSIAVDVGGTAFVGGDLAVIEPISPDAVPKSESCPDGQASSGVATPPAPTEPSRSASAPAASCGHDASDGMTLLTSHHGTRKPLILFKSVRNRLERLGLLPQQHVRVPTSTRSAASSAASRKSSAQGNKTDANLVTYNGLEDLPSFLNRPSLSAEEIEAINDGGVAGLDAAARAWSVSLSFQPVLAKSPTKKAQTKRASA